MRAYPWISTKYVCVCKCVRPPAKKTLGVLFIIVQVSWLLGYFRKFDNFILPQECSHILCAHNLFSPAWYIDSYLYWDVKLVPSPKLRPKEWELILEYRLNMCVYVSVSVPLQITLGVLFIIVQVSWLLGYFRKFDNFILPQEWSHISCAHNLFLPAWYIDSYLYWDVKLVPSPKLRM